MMASSQCLEDSPAGKRASKNGNDLNFQELYNERHRLALEELVSGGIDNFVAFLRKERIPSFLSDDEIQQIVLSAVSVHGDDTTLESARSSMDVSSVTYFPDVSDVEPPLLELGWPGFTTGSYRGVTRAVAHFQPSYGECIYSCKEAARRMIKSAKEVIAIVTDSLTDLDIFKDLQEACTHRKVPVYILLDQSCAPAFLKMCSNISVRLDDLRQMRVRTITGTTYFMRSGARISGKVHERFMLIDGNRVATGSYRFNWTDGKLNSSNLIELSGQITEHFDEEFRILYAQSLPVNTRGPPSAWNSGIYDHHLVKHSVTSSPSHARERPVELVCLTSTPSCKLHTRAPEVQHPREPLIGEAGCKSSPVSDSSTLGNDWMEQQHIQEEILAGSMQRFPADTPAVTEHVPPPTLSCHVSTQTSCFTVDSDSQTDPESLARHTGLQHSDHVALVTQTRDTPMPSATQEQAASSDSSPVSPKQGFSQHGADCEPPVHCGSVGPDSDLRDCFHKLTKERQCHYSTIRAKLEHMVSVLSQRRELVDVTNMTLGLGAHRTHKVQQECGQGQNPGLLVESVGMGTWPRA
ncbi:protein FAM83D [Polymixia lowei]